MKAAFVIFTVIVLVLASVVPAYASTSDIPSNGFFNTVLEFLKGIFIPGKDFFANQISRIGDRVNEKLGGISYLYNVIKGFFSGLSNTNSSTALTFSLPDNYFFSGYKGFSMDVLSSAAPYIKFLKEVLNVSLVLVTAIFCYKRLIVLFDT